MGCKMENCQFIGFCDSNLKFLCLWFFAAGQSRWASGTDQARAGWTTPNGRPNSQGKGTLCTFAGRPDQSPTLEAHKLLKAMKKENWEAKRREDEDNRPDWALALLSGGNSPRNSSCISYTPINTQTSASPFFWVPDLHFNCLLSISTWTCPQHFKLDVFKIWLLIFFLSSYTYIRIHSFLPTLHPVTMDETS